MIIKDTIARRLRAFKPVNYTKAILFTAMFIAVFDNYTFFSKISATYPGQILFLLSVFIIFLCTLIIVLNAATLHRATKPVLIIFLLFSALHSYFTDSFGVIGDQEMIRNILRTHPAEVFDWFNLRLIGYFAVLGLAPAALVNMMPVAALPLKKQLLFKARDIFISLLVIVLCLFAFSGSYASFFREHKLLRLYANPMVFIYSSARLVYKANAGPQRAMAALGRDAKISDKDVKRELVIFVLGETARADRFSLNGYERETNPYLKQEDIINFTDMHSCGTSTMASVPCLFSNLGRNDFTNEAAARSENLLDVLMRTKRINVLWRDNNSDSKGVALRAPYEDFRTQTLNPVCDIECRDVGMLGGLQEYIDRQAAGDFFIVLHQMGNHGPAYYKRYPEKFEIFKPTCQSKDLGACSDEEIGNAYDNAIVYTDYFLSQVIAFLKNNDRRFETAMIYVSDHGESLGENGIYLHGLPYAIAPIAQRKVPLIMWFGDSMKDTINIAALKAKSKNRFSHDNLFHTFLGLMEVETAVHDEEKNIVDARR